MNQQTLKKAYFFEGKGLHTGVYTHMTLMPAPAGSGIRFRRSDMEGCPEVEALAENVSNTARSTTISAHEAVAVTIEHIMSALTGLGVDNAVIELRTFEARPKSSTLILPSSSAMTLAGLMSRCRICF